MERRYNIKEVQEKVFNLPIEEKVAILWDVVSFYKEESEIAFEDLLFFRRIACQLDLEKSLIDLMLD